jgi:hypothetical protein
MLKLLSASVVASAAVLAVSSPASAAALTTNVSVGHVAPASPPNNFSNTVTGASNQIFTPNTPHTPKLKGPVVTDEGGCHTKANSIQRCWP